VTGCNRTSLIESAVGAGAKWTPGPDSGDAAACSGPVVAVGTTCTAGCNWDHTGGGYKLKCNALTLTWGPNEAALGGCAPLVVGETGCNRTLILDSAVEAGAKWTSTSGDPAGCSGPVVAAGTTCTADCKSGYGGDGYKFTCDAGTVTWGPNGAPYNAPYVTAGCVPLVLGVTGCNRTLLFDDRSVGAVGEWTPTSGDAAGCSGAPVAAGTTCHADCTSAYEGPGYDYGCYPCTWGPLAGTVDWTGYNKIFFGGCALKAGGTSCDGDGLYLNRHICRSCLASCNVAGVE
jgi:hypothetical protein